MSAKTPRQLLAAVFPPMLATLSAEPPADGESWAWELKYDGFRAVAALAGRELSLLSRNEIDLAARFPAIVDALRKVSVKEAVLDGEIVALDAEGVPRFQLLQGGTSRERIFVFDLLWLDGDDLRGRPYVERRATLERLLRRAPAGVELAEQVGGSGAEALRSAAMRGWEGIVAKRRGSTYEGRRSKAWLKIKAIREQELAIIGYNLSTASTREIGSLHLAVAGAGGDFHYAGKVGTGFTSKIRARLRQMLASDETERAPAADAPRLRDAHWVTPRYVAQVSFAEWTGDNRLRHPSFLGLRDDKKPEEAMREPVLREQGKKKVGESAVKKAPPVKRAPAARAAVAKVPARAETPRVVLTHPERVLYPRDGITKAEVAGYYDAVAEPLITALRRRPLSLEHWNQGIDKPSWFHQNLGSEAPDWLPIVDTPARRSGRKTVRHLTVEGSDELRWIAQMSALTIHMWSSRAESLESPDWIVFDLDPARGQGIEQAVEAAIVIRGLLEHLRLPSVPKTSGKRGLHVFVPLAPGYTHEQAAQFAVNVAAAVIREVPAMTVERSLSQRRGRLYLDCMQNAYGKTVVAPYSLRAIDGAPVSAPLRWEEVNRKLDPLALNLRTMPERLAKFGDLFAPALKNGARLPEVRVGT